MAVMKVEQSFLDKMQAIGDYLDALKQGDEEAKSRILPAIPIHPEGLQVLKELFGADYIRRRGYNTELADAKYGPDWLDKDD